MKKGYQLSCNGKFLSFSGSRTLFHSNIYMNKEDITEKVIENFKNLCAVGIDGIGLYDLDKSTMEIKINEVNIIE